MEKILFLGGLIPVDDEINDNTINFMNSAANAFQMQFINGIIQNGYEVKVLSAPFIGPYPKSYKKVYYKSKSYKDGYRYVSFNNIWGIRNYFRYKSLLNALKEREYQDIEKVIVYSVHTPFAKVARHLKKKNPNTKICLITPDLPEYMNLRKNKSVLYRIAKRVDCKTFYKLTQWFDCFCLVSVHQSEKVNKSKKQEVVIEAIADKVENIYLPTNNVKKRIVYTGSLNKQFGIMNLVNAVKDMEDVELVLCGSGDALSEIESLSDEKVKYLGVLSHEQVRKVQLKADILVNPRTNEGEYTKYSFPSKTMEYLSTGRPVVCYKLDGIPDEYDDYLIYPKEETIEALRESLGEVIKLSDGDLADIFVKNTSFLRENKNTKFMVKKMIAMFNMV